VRPQAFFPIFLFSTLPVNKWASAGPVQPPWAEAVSEFTGRFRFEGMSFSSSCIAPLFRWIRSTGTVRVRVGAGGALSAEAKRNNRRVSGAAVDIRRC